MTEETLQEQKLRLEIDELSANKKHSNIKLWVSVIGAVVLVSGLFLERYSTLEQRKYELETNQYSRKLERMTDISTDLNELYEKTIDALSRNRQRTWNLYLYSVELQQIIRAVKTEDLELRASLDALNKKVDSAVENLNSEAIPINEWSDVDALKVLWQTKSKSPSPDFSQLFGAKAIVNWQAVSMAAMEALNESHPLSGSHNSAKVKELEERFSEFQEGLYEQITSLQISP